MEKLVPYILTNIVISIALYFWVYQREKRNFPNEKYGIIKFIILITYVWAINGIITIYGNTRMNTSTDSIRHIGYASIALFYLGLYTMWKDE